MKAQPEIVKNASTEEQIKEAARRVFTRKGYAATRTRDIAEESGFNLALINYYFRSKEKLYDIICLENILLFLPSVLEVVNNAETTLKQKIELLVSNYIDMLIKNPGLPLFILNEVHADPAKFIEKITAKLLRPDNIYIVRQWKELAASGKLPAINPIHLFMNALSMTLFPFVASPLLRNRTGMNMEQFNALMEERKKLIPIWIMAIINSGAGAV